jgi:hypothetical protein
MLREMRIRTLLLAAVLVAAAVTVGRALISNDDIGPVEYVAGIVLVLGLILLALRSVRRAPQRG